MKRIPYFDERVVLVYEHTWSVLYDVMRRDGPLV